MRPLFIAVLLCATATPAAALDPKVAITQYRQRIWRAELPQASANAFAQTPDGYMWVSTQEGLVRLSGTQGQLFDNRNVPAFEASQFLALATDTSGVLWIAGYPSGLWRYEPGSSAAPSRFTALPEFRDISVFRLRADAAGALWAPTSRGLFVHHAGEASFTVVSTPGGPSSGLPSSPEATFADASGALWVAGGTAVARRPSHATAFTTLELENCRAHAFALDANDGVILGSSCGLSRLSTGGTSTNGTSTNGTSSNGTSSNGTSPGGSASAATLSATAIAEFPRVNVLALLRDREHTLWVGTERGLARITETGTTTWLRQDALPDQDIRALFEDREGSLWVGTWQGGAVQLSDAPFSVFGAPEGVRLPSTYGVTEDADGTIWAGSHGLGLVHIRGAQAQTNDLHALNPLCTNEVRALRMYRGEVSTPAPKGMCLYAHGAARIEPIGETQLQAQILDDGPHARWLLTRSHLRHESGGRTVTIDSQRIGDTLNFIYRDKRGSIWLNANSGVWHWDGAQFTRLALPPPDGSGTQGTTEDADGNLWFIGRGLTRFKDGVFVRLSTKEGLPADDPMGALDDGLGHLWIGTDSGIWRVSKSDIERLQRGELATLSGRMFGVADGLRSAECNGPEGAIRARDGRLWFATAEGAAVVDPRTVDREAPTVPVVVEEALADGQRLGDSAAAGTHNIELRYAALSFVTPERAHYQYQLAGFDDGWIDAGPRRTAYYTNLPPQDFRFRVRARMSDADSWSEAAPLPFTQRPHPWQTWWARMATGLVLLGAVIAAIKARTAQLERRQSELEAIVADKTRDLTQAQERIAALVESSAEAMIDIPAWSQRMSEELIRQLGLQNIGIWALDGDTVHSLRPFGEAPSSRALRAFGHASEPAASNDASAERIQLPVRGLSGEIFGGLTIVGHAAAPLSEAQRRMLTSFAHQLGSSLELMRMRTHLALAAQKRAYTRAQMIAEGNALLVICPSCGTCFDHNTSVCSVDGTVLPEADLFPLRLAARYRLERVIGEGGSGTVFLARDEKLDRAVAVKLLKGDHFTDSISRLRFAQEARVLARLSHPGVIGVFDSGELDNGAAYLVMEYLRGATLAAVIAAHGQATPAQVVQLLLQGAAALTATHQLGLIHRDLKPDNLFLVQGAHGFQVKILDFGLAKTMAPSEITTQTGIVVGTPHYMSPEQARGETLDKRTDVYSFAVVIFEALTAQRLVTGETLLEVLNKVMTEPPPAVAQFISTAPDAIDEVFAKALSKARSERSDDAVAWAHELGLLLAQLAVTSPGWPLVLTGLGKQALTLPRTPGRLDDTRR